VNLAPVILFQAGSTLITAADTHFMLINEAKRRTTFGLSALLPPFGQIVLLKALNSHHIRNKVGFARLCPALKNCIARFGLTPEKRTRERMKFDVRDIWWIIRKRKREKIRVRHTVWNQIIALLQ
jgi:hypothetical protein